MSCHHRQGLSAKYLLTTYGILKAQSVLSSVVEINAVTAYSRCSIKTRFLNSVQDDEQQMHLHPGPDAVLTLTWPEISMEKQMMLLERGELYPILCWKNSPCFQPVWVATV